MRLGLITTIFSLGVLLYAGAAQADYPDDCLGPGEPSGSDCMGIGYEGCCDSLGRAIWCDGGEMFCIDCAGLNPECGWQGDFYDCGTDGGADPAGDFPKDCLGCDPPCADGQICKGGVCEVCTPDCAGKNCGSDGCGGKCGECAGVCVEGLCHMGPGCEPAAETGCGGCACEECVCELDPFCCETEWDNVCVGECINDCGGCPALKNCGDSQCVLADLETCATCPADCACGLGAVCYKGQCCTPDCTDKVCGDDGCGGVCGQCESGQFCNDLFECEDYPQCESLGEIKCDDELAGTTVGHQNLLDDYSCESWSEQGPEVGYTFTSAAEDDVAVKITYGDDDDMDVFVLEGLCTIDNCLGGGNTEVEFKAEAGKTYHFVVDGFDGSAGAYTISVWCLSTCIPDCTEGPCTEDGCKGICPCGNAGDVCYDGQCCTPDCTGKQCGDDGCGGMTCGECPGNGTCFENVCHSGAGCETADAPTCNGCQCEECVCAMDSYCCQTAWDGICVSECIQECGGCPALENCGDTVCQTEEFESCSNCPGDCPCEDGTVCYKGKCCTPSCEGKECGSDGCGGSCGTCGAGLVCKEGTCVESTGLEECLGPGQPSSDDCMGTTYEGCCDDLGRVLWCENNQLFCIDCAGVNPECGWQGSFYDCGTDGAGDPSGANPKECAGGCDPACKPGQKCVDGECVACTPDCNGKSCGDDGCGGQCGKCPDGATCDGGVCHGGPGCQVEEGPGCGGCACEECVCAADPYCCDTQWDDICVGLCVSDCGGCPVDPVDACGDGICAGNEDCGSCPADCGCPDGQSCKDGACVECTPDCAGKVCGDDGCGGSCGDCDAGEACVAGKCECAAQCDGKVCGDDGCGGSCGTCGASQVCEAGQCVAGCVPACGGKVCGDDGCGGSCGTCGVGENCAEGKCLEACVPTCGDKVCGDDGCGGVCGECGDGESCVEGACQAEEEPVVKKEESGCTTTGTGSPLALALFLALGLAILAVRRVRA